MNNNEFSIVLQTILEKNGIKKELSEIQKIVDKDMIKIIPKLETTSLENDLKSLSKEITQALKIAFGGDPTLNASDVFHSLNQELQKISSTTALISNDLKDATTQLAQSLDTSKSENSFDSIINRIVKLKSLMSPDTFKNFSKNLD